MSDDANTYDAGDIASTTALFEVADVATDPTAVTCKVKNPAGTTTTYTYGTDITLTRSGVGSYRLDIDIPYAAASVGTWYYQWRGTGTAQAVEEHYFVVRPPNI